MRNKPYSISSQIVSPGGFASYGCGQLSLYAGSKIVHQEATMAQRPGASKQNEIIGLCRINIMRMALASSLSAYRTDLLHAIDHNNTVKNRDAILHSERENSDPPGRRCKTMMLTPRA